MTVLSGHLATVTSFVVALSDRVGQPVCVTTKTATDSPVSLSKPIDRSACGVAASGKILRTKLKPCFHPSSFKTNLYFLVCFVPPYPRSTTYIPGPAMMRNVVPGIHDDNVGGNFCVWYNSATPRRNVLSVLVYHGMHAATVDRPRKR